MRANKLVLKRFVLGQVQPGGPLVELEGRAPGLLSFVLSLIGIDPTLSLRCFSDRVEVVEAGLGGRETVVIPLGKVSAIIGGHSRSIRALVVAGIFGMLGGFLMLAGLLASSGNSGPGGGGPFISAMFFFFLATIAVVSFFLSRSMVLAVQNGGDKTFGLRFSQGVIEGVDVNPARVQQAVDMFNRATMNFNHAQAGTAGVPVSGQHFPVSGQRALEA